MKGHFEDKVIIITGSSMGIGKALAELLGKDKAKIVLNGRVKEMLESTERELKSKGYEVLSILADITKEPDRLELIHKTIAHYGKIDVLVNNAGTSMRGRIEDLSPELISTIFEVNTMGPLFLSQLAIPHLKKTRGSVIFISSLAGLRGLPLISIYGSAKMALTGIADSLRVELAADKVHVGICYVGYTEIEKGKTALGPTGEKLPLAERKGLMVSSTIRVSQDIARLIKRRRNKAILGTTGKVYSLLTRYFPDLMAFITHHSYKKMKNAYK